MGITRPLTLDDAPELASLLTGNRGFLAPFEPVRDESFYTVDGQSAVITESLVNNDRGLSCSHVILDNSGAIVGRISLNSIVRGAFQSCAVGYWVAAADNGRGLATAAMRDMARLAFVELGLHRIEGATLLDNVRSQGVLERNGFVRFGVAPAYLNIAGRWQDHAIYQLLAPGR